MFRRAPKASNSAIVLESPEWDVAVVLAPDREYRLASSELGQCSSAFRRILNNKTQGYQDTDSNSTGWRFALSADYNEAKKSQCHLEVLEGWYLMPADHGFQSLLGKTQPPTTKVASAEHGQLARMALDFIFRAMVGSPPVLDCSSPEVASLHLASLSVVTKKLDCGFVVGPAVDTTLEQPAKHLFSFVAQDAASWLVLAMNLESKLLFEEAVIHTVGQYDKLKASTAWSDVPAAVRTLVESKALALEETKKNVELRMFGHYPTTLQMGEPELQNVGLGSRTQRNKGRLPTRASQHGARVIHWMALSLFRHWLGQSFAGHVAGSGAPDGGKSLYSQINAGEETYLDIQAREAFIQHFPLSAKGRTIFDKAVEDIKAALKTYVQPLVQSNCRLDVTKSPVAWLTCAQVSSMDIPWKAKSTCNADLVHTTEHEESSRPAKKPRTEAYSSPAIVSEADNGLDPKLEQGEEVDEGNISEDYSSDTGLYNALEINHNKTDAGRPVKEFARADTSQSGPFAQSESPDSASERYQPERLDTHLDSEPDEEEDQDDRTPKEKKAAQWTGYMGGKPIPRVPMKGRFAK